LSFEQSLQCGGQHHHPNSKFPAAGYVPHFKHSTPVKHSTPGEYANHLGCHRSGQDPAVTFASQPVHRGYPQS